MRLGDKFEKTIVITLSAEDLIKELILSFLCRIDDELDGLITEDTIFQNDQVINYFLTTLKGKEDLIEKYITDENDLYFEDYDEEERNDERNDLLEKLFDDCGLDVKTLVELIKN